MRAAFSVKRGVGMFRVSPAIAAVILVALGLCCAPAPAKAADAGKGEEVTILRDEFGIPNVFAETDEGAVFGAGYAQAEDRLEYLLKQYRRCEGTMSEVFGPENLRDDYRQRAVAAPGGRRGEFPEAVPQDAGDVRGLPGPRRVPRGYHHAANWGSTLVRLLRGKRQQ